MVCKAVSVPNLKLFEQMEIELWAKEIVEFSVIWENGLVGILLVTNMAAAI